MSVNNLFLFSELRSEKKSREKTALCRKNTTQSTQALSQKDDLWLLALQSCTILSFLNR